MANTSKSSKKPANTGKGKVATTIGLGMLSLVTLLGPTACEQPTETVTKYETVKEHYFYFNGSNAIKVIDKTGIVDVRNIVYGMNYLNQSSSSANYIKGLDNFIIIIGNYADTEVIVNNLPKVEGRTVYIAASWLNDEVGAYNVIAWITQKLYENQNLITLGKRSEFSDAKQIVRAAFRPSKQYA